MSDDGLFPADGADADGADADGADADGVDAAEKEPAELDDPAELDAALQAVLLVVDTPAPVEQLARVLDQPADRVAAALERMAESFADTGFDLRATAEGWRFHSRARFAPYVEAFVLDGARTRLTRAALETLAVVAYRQPVTRARIAAVRGVNVDGVVRTLTARGLIVESGTDPTTGGLLYRTTGMFLERLGLGSLDDLPPIAPLLPDVDDIDEP